MVREQQQLLLEGRKYSHEELMEWLQNGSWDDTDERAPLWNFLREWFDASPVLTVHTSGSTGKPKFLKVRKEQMMNSARITCDFLNLKAGDAALLCMSLQYIAGKMMVVRALVSGMNLIYRLPSSHPMDSVNQPVQFAAMVPMQVYNTCLVEQERERLNLVENLIIGGGAVDSPLLKALQQYTGKAFSTYGMTETLSHIALRRLNGSEASDRYMPFDSVKLSLSDEQTLMIEAPQVCDEVLVTNDVARLFPDGSFVISGRKDNIINSGGIKIQLELLEGLLEGHLPKAYVFTAFPDDRLGEALVLLVKRSKRDEEDRPLSEDEENRLKQLCAQLFPSRYYVPKRIFRVDRIPLTGNGKIDRTACRKLAQACLKCPV